ncbi:hypothetical protein [Thioflexithrix psekupsensis]|uniref:General secretion pathway protein GspM n=1 Tax=Thioflexithrix psekupsensis TaxID=1570016 RepID=A0A251XBZ5_9GAMM|nr:hypothetical protein [Thioflexithrix psekupsensis]OUD15435.1 hypothetical protein TPSD3_02595 [Thioflexithrix psekupsensis]
MTLLTEIRNNDRLRWGIWAIFAISASYGLLRLGDWRVELENDYQAAARRWEQVQQIVAQPEWPRRAQQAREQYTQLQARLWQANSEGLAQASFQSWLDGKAKQVGLQNHTVRADPATTLEKVNVWQIKAQLDAEFHPERLFDLLLLLAESPQWVVVERLDISQTTRSTRLQLIVVAFFQVNSES